MPGLSYIAVEVLAGTPPDVRSPSAATSRLLRLANVWLQRRAGGAADELVIVALQGGEAALRDALQPFGLADAVVVALEADDDEAADPGDAVAAWLASFVKQRHAGAIPLASWSPPGHRPGYPADLWWMGMRGDQRDVGRWCEPLAEFLPAPYDAQAATWLTLLRDQCELGEDLDLHGQTLAGLTVAAMARWLAGFSAAAGDTFFDFAYCDVIEAFDLAPLAVGLAFAEQCPEHMDEAKEYDDITDVQGFVVRALLVDGCGFHWPALRRHFGGAGPLFYSLHASIWPKFHRPAAEACADLLSPSFGEMGALAAAWQLVDAGDWSEVDDSL